MSEELLMGLFLCKLMQGRREGEREGLREGGREGTKKDLYMLHMEKLIVQNMIVIVQVQCSNPIREFLLTKFLLEKHQ